MKKINKKNLQNPCSQFGTALPWSFASAQAKKGNFRIRKNLFSNNQATHRDLTQEELYSSQRYILRLLS